MKRKKHIEKSENEHINATNQEVTLGQNIAKSKRRANNECDEVDMTLLKTRSSRRRKNISGDGLESAVSQEVPNGDDRIEYNALPDASAQSETVEITNSKAIALNGSTNRRLYNGVKRGRANGATPVKRPQGRNPFSTPHKVNGTVNGTLKLERHADRSARRKSTRRLIEGTLLGNTSDGDEEQEDIALHIYGTGDEEEEDDLVQDEVELDGEASATSPAIPSKRGRPKGSKNRHCSPSPPLDLPAHEVYFSQNRGGRSKTSYNNLSSLALLNHEEYFGLVRQFQDPHASDIEWLQELHTESFKQWQFELSQNFNICLFGWGSKRSLLMKFAEHIYKSQSDHAKNKIVVVNGYVHNLTIRDVLNTVADAVSDKGTKLGSEPAQMLANLLALLEEDKTRIVTVITHSIDRAPLRRPTTQTILSRLSSHPQIHFVASADHPSFPLLWDSSLRSTYNFLFHDCTTCEPYTSEIDVVEEVHELLGRSGRRVGGKEGVSFVLKSLPENAKNLFKVLIGEQLAAMDDVSGAVFGGADDDEYDGNKRRAGNYTRNQPGVEYRVLYQKAVEEFICSNEMNFRTLLKEFHDHQMIQSRKDTLGTEILSVPFRKEELETILEDIAS